MANITKYLEKKLLEQSVGKTQFSSPTTFSTYVALFTSAPTVDYTANNPDGEEVTSTGTNYSRVSVTWSSAVSNVDLTNSSYIKNNVDALWPTTGTISGNWGTVTTIGIFDSPTVGGGNLLWFGSISQPVALVAGDTFELSTNAIILTLG